MANSTSPVVSPDLNRRRDARRTRQRLVEVAGRHFAEHGYDGTSVRAVAREAGVAANLITRYFGGKAGLFAAATTIDLRARAALAGPPQTLGDRIAHGVVGRWESADAADPLLMMIRSAGTSPSAAEALAKFFATQASGPLAHADRESLSAWLGDRLQRLLDGPPPPPLVPALDGHDSLP